LLSNPFQCPPRIIALAFHVAPFDRLFVEYLLGIYEMLVPSLLRLSKGGFEFGYSGARARFKVFV